MFSFLLFFFFFRAVDVAYGISPARSWIGPAAVRTCHSHSNLVLEPHLWPTPQVHGERQTLNLLSEARDWSCILVDTRVHNPLGHNWNSNPCFSWESTFCLHIQVCSHFWKWSLPVLFSWGLMFSLLLCFCPLSRFRASLSQIERFSNHAYWYEIEIKIERESESMPSFLSFLKLYPSWVLAY